MWYNVLSLSNHFRFFYFFLNECQGIWRNIHFKLLWFVIYFKHDPNWKEVNMADSSQLFETLHAANFLAFNIWPRLEGHLTAFPTQWLKNPTIPDKFHITCEWSSTLFVRNMRSWCELFVIKLSSQSFLSRGYHTTSCTLSLPSF